MDTLTYKGYEIHASPYELSNTGGWTINIHIYRHHGNETRSRQYSAGNCYKTREEAVSHCFNFGKQIIDGKSESCTVDDL